MKAADDARRALFLRLKNRSRTASRTTDETWSRYSAYAQLELFPGHHTDSNEYSAAPVQARE